MKVVVLSDTHIPTRAKELPKRVLEELEGADAVIHAGDFEEWKVAERLVEFAPLYAVYGNMDWEEVRRRLPERRVVELFGQRIAIVHGWGAPHDLPQRVRRLFEDEEGLSCIVFGHSHRPFNNQVEGVLCFNPGSPTDSYFSPYLSFGVLTVDEEGVRGKIIAIEGG